ncbi:zinc chelation protein SecC [Chryseobacterium sp. G0201]|uniref:zinc chelation protein SecC n=1 Tax=Chryseobacterium sp. G0201 TaxID=2487065 RepID=UPI000F4DD21B|nr:zinc chelation protein SecC [Chryseobacterium sp. G0201]AZA55362.1 zinc chelation protein SecC [Chryseobacterium sp. G0201]
MSDKIEDNSSFEEFRNNIKGGKAIKQIASLLAPFSKTAKNVLGALENFEDLEKQFKEISKSPDSFNKYFSELGWIAHESINHNLMLECIQLAESGSLNTAEEKLADYYTSEEMSWLVSSVYGVPEFRKRNELINAAYEDTKAKKFYSAIPLLLMIIDGTVNDISKSKGFFAENTDLTAWDSIAAHSTGLSKLRDILNVTRKGTTTDEIFFPYRNGILHGRDISYGNKYVAAKSWLTLFAINDWAKALKRNKENPPKENKKQNLKESLIELKNSTIKYQERQLKFKEMDNYMNCWKERKPIIGEDFPSKGALGDYKDFTPEKDAINFLINWQNNNYGAIAKQISFFTKEVNFGKEAGRVRKIFENKKLKDFEIVSIDHKAPAITEIVVIITILFNEKEYVEEILLRMIYENEQNENLVFGQSGGIWKIIDSFFFAKIEYLGY